MFSRVRTAIRFFFVGLAVGVLLAPRSGEETRNMLREKADGLLNDVLDAASLGAGAGTRPTAPMPPRRPPPTTPMRAARPRSVPAATAAGPAPSPSTTAASEAGV